MCRLRSSPGGVLSLLILLMVCRGEARTEAEGASSQPFVLRVATFNIEDLRSEEVADAVSPRARAAAAVLQRIRPDVVLVNELVYDQAEGPSWVDGAREGRNGQRFADNFLAVSQAVGLEPLYFQAFMRPSNTGMASGFDFDNDGRALTEWPAPPPAKADPESRRQTPEGRAYGGDTWGFGTFPGQYGMALLVRRDFHILEDRVRTFRLFPWSAMPDALVPADPETGEPWYSPAEWSRFRLSSKSHWDVPVRLPNGAVVHFLVSHPTPPAFDGPERRNQMRNHDEIRLWADYLSDADYIVDDEGRRGGLAPGALFVILGDLNADPRKGNSFNNPVGRLLLAHPRVAGEFTPQAKHPGVDPEWRELDGADTTAWRMRVDYVLPSVGFEVLAGAVERPTTEATRVSDHFPVWLDLSVPPD